VQLIQKSGDGQRTYFYFALQQLSASAEVAVDGFAKELAVSLARNVEFLRRLPRLNGMNGFGAQSRSRSSLRSPLMEVTGFGSNPGNLRMFAFVPPELQQPRALVVVLHGCGQIAADYDLGAGWSTLAGHYGFALLMPEQQLSNNANGCFNWFSPEHTQRGRGEACSIRQMVMRMVRDHKIDLGRIFVTGLSAGGAMTSVMLATYPDVFAAGAIIAGLPYGVATNVREALSGMLQSRSRAPRELGDLVRHASNHRGPWPRVSVWHGSADLTVNPGNADQIVKQWLDVHRLPVKPMSEGMVNGYPRQVWWNTDGDTLIESYSITDMAHGTPLGVAENEKHYGIQGAFLIDAGISSSYHIASFFGLTEWIRQPKARAAESPSARLIPAVSPISPPVPKTARDAPQLPAPTKPNAPAAFVPEVAERRSSPLKAKLAPKSQRKPARRRLDLGAVLARALNAGALMKYTLFGRRTGARAGKINAR
jgi:poly(hydroxyalkanoate) depolymerase family esterase